VVSNHSWAYRGGFDKNSCTEGFIPENTATIKAVCPALSMSSISAFACIDHEEQDSSGSTYVATQQEAEEHRSKG